MCEEIRLTRDIHDFVRGHLSWEESLRLLDEIVDSEVWLSNLEVEMQIYGLALLFQDKGNKVRDRS